MKTEFRIDVLVGIQANPIPAPNILQRAGNGVARARLYIGAKSKIAAAFETGKTRGKRVNSLFEIAGLRIRGRRVTAFVRQLAVSGLLFSIQLLARCRRGLWSCEKIGIERDSPPCISARRGVCVIKKISRSHRS